MITRRSALLALICVTLVATADCHPTVYKRNQYDNLEPDMVAVSSTVIPLPAYKVHASIPNVESTASDKTSSKNKYYSMSIPLKQYLAKLHNIEEPYKLITVHSKKAAYQELKKTSGN